MFFFLKKMYIGWGEGSRDGAVADYTILKARAVEHVTAPVAAPEIEYPASKGDSIIMPSCLALFELAN